MKSTLVTDIAEIFAASPTKRWALFVGAVLGIYWIGIDSYDFFQNHVAPWLWPAPEIPI